MLEEDVLDAVFLDCLTGIKKTLFKWKNCPLRCMSLRSDLSSLKNGLKEAGVVLGEVGIHKC